MTKEEYKILYPQRQHPSTNTFRTLLQQLYKSGRFIFNYHNSRRPIESQTVQLKERINNKLNEIGYVNILKKVLDNVPSNLRHNILYMYNGVPAHNT